MKKTSLLLLVTILFAALHHLSTQAQSCVGTASLTVAIVAPPTMPTITANAGQLTSSSTVGNQWYLNGAPIAGATSPSIDISGDGAYTVEVTIDGCSNTSEAFVVTGIAANGLSAQVLVYPNPATDWVVCRLQGVQNGSLQVQLLNLNGQVLYNTQAPVSNHAATISIPTDRLSAGVYWLHLTNEKGSLSHQLIKQ